MHRVIRPGRSAYLRPGLIMAAVAVLFIAVWIRRGTQTGAWIVVIGIGALYGLWCLILSRRRILITESTITLTYLLHPPRTIVWRQIDRSELTYWIDGRPFQILAFGSESETPLLNIPIPLYNETDIEWLQSLPALRPKDP